MFCPIIYNILLMNMKKQTIPLRFSTSDVVIFLFHFSISGPWATMQSALFICLFHFRALFFRRVLLFVGGGACGVCVCLCVRHILRTLVYSWTIFCFKWLHFRSSSYIPIVPDMKILNIFCCSVASSLPNFPFMSHILATNLELQTSL